MSVTSIRQEPPTMIASESAHRLALNLAANGHRVVYRCHDMWSVSLVREELEYLVHRKYWFSFWIMAWWRVLPLAIQHKHGGSIHFCVGWNVVGDVALEVLAK